MTTDEQLRNVFENLQAGARQAQLRWVKVTSIDKQQRTMDATGLADNLPYFDIQLGMGAFNLYPKPGTCCLVGIVEGQETDAFLISAQEIDTLEITASSSITINGGDLGGLVKVKELTEAINKMVKTFNAHTHQVAGVTPGSGSVTAPAPVSGMATLIQGEIENIHVKQ